MLAINDNPDNLEMSIPCASPGAIIRRLERYRLQAVARSVLPEANRISGCLRRRIKQRDIEVWQATESGTAHYRGLQACGSVWVCPLCAAKITERRRSELSQAIETWKGQGHDVLMLTLTVPHHQLQSVGQVIEHIAQPLRLMKHRKTWKRIGATVGLKGTIRALETTYGVNGWHVHIHMLLFVTTKCRGAFGTLRTQFTDMWESACKTSFGIMPSKLHGACLDGGEKAGDYAAKWGLDLEMTKAHCKVGREGSLTPWDLLRAIKDGKQDQDYASLFNEYAAGFRGRHQLEWSRGLRDLLDLGEEETDEEIAAKVESEAVRLGSLTIPQWRAILAEEKRGELLEVASTGGWSAVIDFIESLSQRTPPVKAARESAQAGGAGQGKRPIASPAQ